VDKVFGVFREIGEEGLLRVVVGHVRL